jgi:hypothetical protein
MITWPDDADGDVLKRMEAGGFDFEKPCLIDFNVDFGSWPPSAEALKILERNFPSAKLYEPSGEAGGYVQFQLFEKLTYELVIRIQVQVSEWMDPYDGVCDSWGVLH